MPPRPRNQRKMQGSGGKFAYFQPLPAGGPLCRIGA
jgi:hypothetical protein